MQMSPRRSNRKSKNISSWRCILYGNMSEVLFTYQKRKDMFVKILQYFFFKNY